MLHVTQYLRHNESGAPKYHVYDIQAVIDVVLKFIYGDWGEDFMLSQMVNTITVNTAPTIIRIKGQHNWMIVEEQGRKKKLMGHPISPNR